MMSSVVYREKYALVIGINQYHQESLKYCINDAEDLTNTLEGIGFHVTPAMNCTLSEFYGLIHTFTGSFTKNDLVLFYFAGHGKQKDDDNFLLPSDYDYNYQGDERDYIIKHAVNVKHIIKKIDDRKCRVTIYLFDCCRNMIRTRATNANQGVSSMCATGHTLIVYACAPGKAVQDETRNDRNGSFIENLLKYIITPDKDIEEIMKDVAAAVELQTNGFQVPYRTASLTRNVFLVTNVPRPSSLSSRTSSNISSNTLALSDAPRTLPLLKNSSSIVRSNSRSSHLIWSCCDVSNISLPTNRQVPQIAREAPTWGSHSPTVSHPHHNTPRDRCELKLPTCGTEPNTARSRINPIIKTQIISPKGTPRHGHGHSKNQNNLVQSTDLATNCAYSTQRVKPMTTNRSAIYQKYFQDDDDDEEPAIEAIPFANQPHPHPNFLKLTPRTSTSFAPADQSNNGLHSTIVTMISTTKCDQHSKRMPTSAQPPENLIIFVQSLEKSYELQIPLNSTIDQLKNSIWQTMDIAVERCRKDTHVLLLFTHRMHIFLGEEGELVSDFMKLTPVQPHFYFYALKRYEQSSEMYTYETKISNLFAIDATWWIPIHFMEDIQLTRPQSVLLSSLYALHLFFYKHDDHLLLWRQAMEAQFFVQLRRYLFPPAVLALKHAIEGALFWFEKPLIVDSLLQLLISFCPLNIKRNELCDCIPLLFCWLLEQCDPTATDSDFYQVVNLVDITINGKHYFDDPATAHNANPVPLVMRERMKIPIEAIRHVDIRSFTRYMQDKRYYANITSCKCENYLIYDPPKTASVTTLSISRLTNDQVKQLYAIMAQKYTSFTLITRDALHATVNDQLVVMRDRTVAVLLSRKRNQRPKSGNLNAPREVEQFFEIFNPLQHTVGKRHCVAADQLYQSNKNNSRDPALPEHFFDNLCNIPHSGNVPDSSQSASIQQITVIVLDISRSMFEKPASPDSSDSKTVFDMGIIMLGTLCDSVAFQYSVHDVGLIHFGTSVDVVCPITRNRDQFEKALGQQPRSEEWTCMYDALSKATSLIVTHEQNNQKLVAADCRRLIICISDGIDNYSKITLDALEDRLKKYHITVDFISFLRDDLLKPDKPKKVNYFRQLCKKTHGYIYRNLPLTNIELAATFEREAAVWICEREPKSFGFVDKPVHRMPAELHEKATHKIPAQLAQNDQNASNSTRVLREAHNVTREPLENVNVYVCRNCVFFWKVILQGPSGTPYEGAHWMLYVHFDTQYPRQPPKVRFVTEIYHVNVSADGRICHELFGRGWNSNVTMIDVFRNILQLLKEPNFDDAVSTEKAQMKRDQPHEYDRQLKECVRQHASKSIDQLKREYELEDW